MGKSGRRGHRDAMGFTPNPAAAAKKARYAMGGGRLHVNEFGTMKDEAGADANAGGDALRGISRTSLNGVKIYNLTTGKTLPQWQSDKQRQSMKKDEAYRRRVELMQDFHFNTASRRVKMSPDGRFVAATGVYPPTVKVFECDQLAL